MGDAQVDPLDGVRLELGELRSAFLVRAKSIGQSRSRR
jgi:hypothetical protein